MEKEQLIKKWLDFDLNESEKAEFEKLPEFNSLNKLSDGAKLFKDNSSFNVDAEFSKLNSIITKKREEKDVPTITLNKEKTLMQKLKPLMQIAAVLVVGLGVYFGPFYDNTATIKTAQNTKVVTLPDASLVALNQDSQIRYKKSDFKDKRIVNLVGEADFDVKEGSVFEVVTWSGTINDLVGTKFTVSQRPNSFEIFCKEGEVSFSYKGKIVRLPAGKKLNIIDGKIVEAESKLA